MLGGKMAVPVLFMVLMIVHSVHRCSAVNSPLSWPAGTYGLPKPNGGCPTGWSEGYRYHDTEDSSPNNQWSDPLDLDGSWGRGNMEYKFCMKTQTRLSEPAWPAGSYCIYKRGTCPSGFQSGTIRWDDEDTSNANRDGGTLPDGDYGANTRIYFCCRSDAVATQAISLPKANRFMLLSRYDSCQQVRGMTVTKEWFRWDNEDDNNIDSQSGSHPYEGVQSSGENVKLNFCFYEPASGSSWPDGTYGLPKPLAGCPSGWEDGYRYHDTEDSSPSNQWSDPLHLAGTYGRANMEQHFCMKTVADFTGTNWPQGNYCIYRKGGSCPTECYLNQYSVRIDDNSGNLAGYKDRCSCFARDQHTYIYWDDEDNINANRLVGVVPDGTYDRNTRIFFCCRSDGVTSRGITLPTEDDFFMFSRFSTCQEVYGMTVTGEWFRWDNEDDSNADSQTVVHPYEGVQRGGNVRLTFCYYQQQ